LQEPLDRPLDRPGAVDPAVRRRVESSTPAVR
jgi:hypothetical protein